MKDQNDLFKGLAISGLGGYGLFWVFNQPCNVAANPMLGLTTEMARLVCLSSDAKLTIVMIIASAALFAGISRVIQNI